MSAPDSKVQGLVKFEDKRERQDVLRAARLESHRQFLLTHPAVLVRYPQLVGSLSEEELAHLQLYFDSKKFLRDWARQHSAARFLVS